MAMRPTFLNAVVAWLFIIGSACFVLGSVPAYLDAVGGVADGVTFVVGSIFFTAASLGQLLQAQTPAMTSPVPSQRGTPVRFRLWSWLPTIRTGSRPPLSLLPKHPSTSCLRPAADDRPARDNDQSALPGQRVEAPPGAVSAVGSLRGLGTKSDPARKDTHVWKTVDHLSTSGARLRPGALQPAQ